MISEGEEVSGVITGLAFGGQGILRHHGFVIFVPFTAIGDHISCRIVTKKKSFATAEVVNLKIPSAERVKPLCPYFGVCGGCQLQHIEYSAQLKYKQSAVFDALKRIGHIATEVPPVVPAELQWAYRRHITLTLNPSNGAFAIGYIAVDNTSLVEVNCCPIFINDPDPIIKQVRSFISRLKNPSEASGKATLLKVEEKYIVSISFDNIPENCSEICEETLSKYENWDGIAVVAPDCAMSFGTTTAFCQVDGLLFEYSPHVFMQNHPEQSKKIYHHVCEIAAQVNASCIIDLYCGIGITTVLFARQGADVIGVEYNPQSIQLAKKNALKNKIEQIHFVQGDVKKVLKSILKEKKPDLILVNPPRMGMEPHVIKMLLESSPKDIIYISCMPSTLARDIQFYGEKYAIRSCKVFDMFPQTAHVETVVHLQRR